MSGIENGEKIITESRDQVGMNKGVANDNHTDFDWDEGPNNEWGGEGEPLQFADGEVMTTDAARTYWNIKVMDALRSLEADDEKARQKIAERYPLKVKISH